MVALFEESGAFRWYRGISSVSGIDSTAGKAFFEAGLSSPLTWNRLLVLFDRPSPLVTERVSSFSAYSLAAVSRSGFVDSRLTMRAMRSRGSMQRGRPSL